VNWVISGHMVYPYFHKVNKVDWIVDHTVWKGERWLNGLHHALDCMDYQSNDYDSWLIINYKFWKSSIIIFMLIDANWSWQPRFFRCVFCIKKGLLHQLLVTGLLSCVINPSNQDTTDTERGWFALQLCYPLVNVYKKLTGSHGPFNPFIDCLPVKNGNVPVRELLNYQRVAMENHSTSMIITSFPIIKVGSLPWVYNPVTGW
jgi:hypothetical protein